MRHQIFASLIGTVTLMSIFSSCGNSGKPQVDEQAIRDSIQNAIMQSVTARMEQLNNREWAARQRQLAHDREMERVREDNRSTETRMRIKAQRDTNIATIKAVRDVAVEYERDIQELFVMFMGGIEMYQPYKL